MKNKNIKEAMLTRSINLIQKIVTESVPYNDELNVVVPAETSNELDGYAAENVTVSDGVIKIKSLTFKSKIIAEHSYNILNKEDALAFFKKAEELYCESLNCAKLTIVEEFIYAGSKELDIFLNAKACIENGHDPFFILQLLTLGMNKPLLYSYKSFIEFFVYTYEKIENDLATNGYVKSFCDFIFKDEEVCLKICSEYNAGRNRFLIPIYNRIVVRFYKDHSWIKDNIVSEIETGVEVDPNTVFLLGRILLDEKISCGPQINLIVSFLEHGSEEQKNSAYNALALQLGEPYIDSIFKKALLNKTSHAISMIALSLFQDWQKYTFHPDFEFWMESLAYIAPELKGAEQWRDYVFSQSIDSHYELVMKSLESTFLFYKEQGKIIEMENVFPSTLSKFSKHISFSTQLLKWLNTPDSVMPRASVDIVRFAAAQRVQFDFTISELAIETPEELLFICRRILGYIFEVDFLIPAFVSFASFYRNDSVYLDIIFQCMKIVAFDYPPQGREALTELANNSSESEAVLQQIKDLLKKMDGYFDALHVLPVVSELTPTRAEEKLFQNEKHKNMQKELKKAYSQSVSRQLVSTVPLKAGKAFFSLSDDLSSLPTQLTTHETSFAIPRSALFDPLGYEIERFEFRYHTKGKI